MAPCLFLSMQISQKSTSGLFHRKRVWGPLDCTRQGILMQSSWPRVLWSGGNLVGSGGCPVGVRWVSGGSSTGSRGPSASPANGSFWLQQTVVSLAAVASRMELGRTHLDTVETRCNGHPACHKVRTTGTTEIEKKRKRLLAAFEIEAFDEMMRCSS